MIITVTGHMASGKNTVCKILEDKGYLSIDLDKVAHSSIEANAHKIYETFKEDALRENLTIMEDGHINRRNLGLLLFKDPSLLKKQEDIIYPYIIEETYKFIHSHKDENLIINATVLYKTPELLKLSSKVFFVTAPYVTRLIRSMRRDHMKAFHIMKRFRSQRNLYKEYKAFNIPIIKINNRGSLEDLIDKINKL